MEADLHSYLLANSGVASEIGTRLYPEILPQNPTLPAIVYTSISEQEEELMDATSAGFMGRLVQFTAWARTAIDAEQAIQSIKDALRTLAVDNGESPVPTIGILRGANVENVRSGIDTTTGFYRRDADFRIWHA